MASDAIESTAPEGDHLFDLSAAPVPSARKAQALLKWPGGKGRELPALLAKMPGLIEGRFIDPFVGGGIMAMHQAQSVPVVANDNSIDLINLYRGVAEASGMLEHLVAAAESWTYWAGRPDKVAEVASAYRAGEEATFPYSALRVGHQGAAFPSVEANAVYDTIAEREIRLKLKRIRTVEERRHELSDEDLLNNVEGAFRAVWYLTARSRYNTLRLSGDSCVERTVHFYFLRELAYAAMFRFSGKGAFNVPYGGVSYNQKDLVGKVEALMGGYVQAAVGRTTYACSDFEVFLSKSRPRAEDFVFMDPPYDSTFSTYDNRAFTIRDHERLAQLMRSLPCKALLIVGDSPVIRETYMPLGWSASAWSKKYAWNIKSRSDPNATHLVFTNY